MRRNRDFDQKPQLLGDENTAAGTWSWAAPTPTTRSRTPATLAPWSPPDELRRAWQEHEELAGLVAASAAYTPPHGASIEAALLRLRAAPPHRRRHRGRRHAPADRQAARPDRRGPAAGPRLDRRLAGRAGGVRLVAGPGPNARDQLKDDFDGLWRDEKATPKQYIDKLPTGDRITEPAGAPPPDRTAARQGGELSRRLPARLRDPAAGARAARPGGGELRRDGPRQRDAAARPASRFLGPAASRRWRCGAWRRRPPSG